MKKLHLLPVGNVDAQLLEWLGQALYDKFRMQAEILLPALDPAFALHAEWQQYHSSEILASMQRYVSEKTWRILGVTQLDLYIPILTFVFGEAQLGGKGAVVSYHRFAAGILRFASGYERSCPSVARRVGARAGTYFGSNPLPRLSMCDGAIPCGGMD